MGSLHGTEGYFPNTTVASILFGETRHRTGVNTCLDVWIIPPRWQSNTTEILGRFSSGRQKKNPRETISRRFPLSMPNTINIKYDELL